LLTSALRFRNLHRATVLILFLPAALAAATFNAPAVYISGVNPGNPGNRTIPLLTGDFNGDGKADVVGIGGDAPTVTHTQIAVSFGNGDGTFALPVTTILPGGYSSAEGAGAGDFNGDGKLDLLLAIQSAGVFGQFQFQVWLGDGTGKFTAGSFVIGNTALARVSDFNGTGAWILSCWLPVP
jgi:FG-GAP-like repeat